MLLSHVIIYEIYMVHFKFTSSTFYRCFTGNGQCSEIWEEKIIAFQVHFDLQYLSIVLSAEMEKAYKIAHSKLLKN